jgi:alpha-glucosidase (family GH31 glycosyl hydrolase)
MIMTRHAFLGSGQYSAKWLGEYDAQWDDFRRSIVATVEMNMFGFSLVIIIKNKTSNKWKISFLNYFF